MYGFVCCFCLALGLSVCQLDDFCRALCLLGGNLGLSVYLYKLCLAWGLSVCASVQVMFSMGFVCLSVCTSYV